MIDLNIYHKIKELKEMGVKHYKILEMVGISNKQYYKYATLDEEVYRELINKDKANGIDNYREFIISLISVTPQINNSTILYRTHEEFPDFSIKRNTYLRYIDKIRQETGYIKKTLRSFSLREEPIPGFEAQVDFGQYVIKDMYGINRRIYMFCMVLSYSRMRFCYFSVNPFTTKTAIEAHEYAFRYFGGRPQHILYDQDRVFVVSEMFGEYKLVKEFAEYVRFRGFTVQLCHKWDPNSKGKVETTVKAIKRGFLDGRIYAGIDSLNSDCLIWLDNIGNGDINYTTRKIPRDMFIEESKHLQKVNFFKKKYDTILIVEDTNSVVYKGNQYQLPKEELLAGGRVKVVEDDGILIFYRPFSTEPICKLEIASGIGHIISAKKGTKENIEKIQFLKFFSNEKIVKDYIDKVESAFLAPNIRLRQYKRMCKLTRYYKSEELLEGVKYCIKKEDYGVYNLISFMVARFGRVKAKPFMSNSNIKGYSSKINEIKKELNENG